VNVSNKIKPKKEAAVPESEVNYSDSDLQKFTAFFEILVEIDQKQKSMTKDGIIKYENKRRRKHAAIREKKELYRGIGVGWETIWS
jgi:hypothetical protein